MTAATLSPAGRRLLRALGRYDEGNGVVFKQLPRNNWRLLTNGDVFNGKTFHPLERLGFAEVGYQNSDPVKITDKGREYLKAKDGGPLCANEAHGKRQRAVANLTWPDGPYKPTTACRGDVQWMVRDALDEGHPILVEPIVRGAR